MPVARRGWCLYGIVYLDEALLWDWKRAKTGPSYVSIEPHYLSQYRCGAFWLSFKNVAKRIFVEFCTSYFF